MKFSISSYFAQITSIVSYFRKYYLKDLKPAFVFSKSKKVRKTSFWPSGGIETTIKLCIFFSLVQINAITSIDVLWSTHNRSLYLPESLNYFEKAVENCLFLAVTITLVAAL